VTRVSGARGFSGTVRDAFIARGHDAVSCNPLPTERPGPHHQGGVGGLVAERGWESWDLLVAHPPCTHLAVSGARWLKGDPQRMKEHMVASEFFQWLLDAPVPSIAVENPVMIRRYNGIRPHDFSVQPWRFGHGEIKRTCFRTRGLPPPGPTDVVEGREARVHRASPGPDRWKERSRTYQGIADAMAGQWGGG